MFSLYKLHTTLKEMFLHCILALLVKNNYLGNLAVSRFWINIWLQWWIRVSELMTWLVPCKVYRPPFLSKNLQL